MKARPTIFLSGVSHEFASFRDAVEIEIQKKGCFAENQASFAPDYRTVEQMLRRRLQDADAVVHLVGFRFGAEPNERPAQAPRRSYTHMEFHIAREMHKPVYVFLSTGASVRDEARPDEEAEGAEAAALQLAHREEIQAANHLHYFFGDKAELCRLVAQIAPVQAAGFHADISRIDKYAPAQLIGREAELRLLDDAWASVRDATSPRPHVLSFVALGGEGKTSLVAKWAAGLAHHNWPGCDAVFAWSFYSQGTREQTAASSDLFLKEALTVFGDPAMAGSAQGAFDKGRRLAQLVGERRALLILDGLEPLQYPPTSPTPGELKDHGLAALLKGLAAANQGLCVLTTRYSIPDLRAYRKTTAPEIDLARLSRVAGVALLRSLGVKGRPKELEALVEEVQGHALTLNLLGSYLRDAHAGDIRKRDVVKLEEADAEEQAGHAFRVMEAYERWFESEGEKGRRAVAVLRLLGLFDRPASADCLAALLDAPAIAGLTEALAGTSEAQRNLVFTRLEAARLLTVHRDAAGTLLALDAHPLLREYFAHRLRTQHPEAWRTAHRRLYLHLCTTTPDKDQGALEDYQPLYQALAHGCLAGLQQETWEQVYCTRIEYLGTNWVWLLGAYGSDLGGIACFFETRWNRVSPALTAADQARVMARAAFSLRALGRLTESREPMRAGLAHEVFNEDWEGAATSANNLSELALTLGDVAGAVKYAEQCVACADRGGDVFEHASARATHADALYQAGRRAEAQARFREAEALQSDDTPHYPLLYSLASFRYCDLLLAPAERGAWRAMLACGDGLPHAEALRAVEQRAAQTLQWAEGSGIDTLGGPLDHLTLGRAALYAAILEGGPAMTAARRELDDAVDGLRRAGEIEFVALGHLTRAWLRGFEGKRTGPESAQSDLDDAWDIAERGPMPLFLADIHLHRARLFGGGLAPQGGGRAYPWESAAADLAAARRLIEKHGYWRRKEELEDAEAAAVLWRPATQ